MWSDLRLMDGDAGEMPAILEQIKAVATRDAVEPQMALAIYRALALTGLACLRHLAVRETPGVPPAQMIRAMLEIDNAMTATMHDCLKPR